MYISSTDDFDLSKIARSGQCFRVKEFEDGRFRFVTGKGSAVHPAAVSRVL